MAAPMNMAPYQRSAGFTLIELMVTVAMLGVLLSVAGPSFRDLLAAQRVRSAASSLVSDLVLARSEALKRGRDVALTAAEPGWAGGWTMGVPGTQEILGQQNALDKNVAIPKAPSAVVFNRNGRLTDATVPFEITATNSNSNSVRCISLDISGLPKSTARECPGS